MYWSQDRELLATVVDAILAVQVTLVNVNTPKGKSPQKFRPMPRPEGVGKAKAKPATADEIRDFMGATGGRIVSTG